MNKIRLAFGGVLLCIVVVPRYKRRDGRIAPRLRNPGLCNLYRIHPTTCNRATPTPTQQDSKIISKQYIQHSTLPHRNLANPRSRHILSTINRSRAEFSTASDQGMSSAVQKFLPSHDHLFNIRISVTTDGDHFPGFCEPSSSMMINTEETKLVTRSPKLLTLVLRVVPRKLGEVRVDSPPSTF